MASHRPLPLTLDLTPRLKQSVHPTHCVHLVGIMIIWYDHDADYQDDHLSSGILLSSIQQIGWSKWGHIWEECLISFDKYLFVSKHQRDWFPAFLNNSNELNVFPVVDKLLLTHQATLPDLLPLLLWTLLPPLGHSHWTYDLTIIFTILIINSSNHQGRKTTISLNTCGWHWTCCTRPGQTWWKEGAGLIWQEGNHLKHRKRQQSWRREKKGCGSKLFKLNNAKYAPKYAPTYQWILSSP